MAIDLIGNLFNITEQQIEKGQDLDLDFSIANNGNEDAAPFSFDLVISQDGFLTRDDYVLGTYRIPDGVEAGSNSGVRSFRYQTPDAASSFWLDEDSNYTVGIRLDRANEIPESDEINNSNQGLGVDFDQVGVLEFGDADLVGTINSLSNSVSASSGEGITVTPGSYLDLNFSIQNLSANTANPFSVDIYLSKDGEIGTGDAKLGRYDIRDILEGNQSTGPKTYSYRTPDPTSGFWLQGDGEYQVLLDIDSRDEVDESDTGNNLGISSVDIAGIDPGLIGGSGNGNGSGNENEADLVVSGFTAPSDLQAGETTEVEYTITNNGGSAAEMFAAGFYLFDEEFNTSSLTLDISDVPEVSFIQGDQASSLIDLQPGESKTMTTELTIPSEWSGFAGPGDYYLGVEADPFDDVVETDDSNNSFTEVGQDYQKVSINNAPTNDAPTNDGVDLVGTHFEVVQDQITPGELFDLGFTVANEGTGEATPFSFDLYLSSDETITAEDTKIGTYDIVENVAGGADTGLKSSRYRAPAADDALWNGDGKYYAGMIINPEQDIVETNTANNSNVGENLDYASTQVMGLDSVGDLKAESLTLSSQSITAGTTFEATYEISNAGEAPADMFAAGFYVFTEDYLGSNDSLNMEDIPEAYFIQGDQASSLISLNAGESTTMTTELTMPSDWDGFSAGSGDYYVGLAVDPFGDVAESDETNNSLNGENMDYVKVNVDVV